MRHGQRIQLELGHVLGDRQRRAGARSTAVAMSPRHASVGCSGPDATGSPAETQPPAPGRVGVEPAGRRVSSMIRISSSERPAGEGRP